MSNIFSRVSTASTYDAALRNITIRQNALVTAQEQLSSGKRVMRASDDPTAAAQAERAVTRQGRIETDQRALEAQRNSMAAAESTLGDSVSALQSFRELVVAAGNGGYSATDRESIAQQLTTLRNQIFSYANQKDSNGLPFFSGLGSSETPFSDTAGGVVFQGLAGQTGSSDVAVPGSLDGNATWMSVPTGNGMFEIKLGTNTGTAWADTGKVTNPSALTGNNYTLTFGTDPTTGEPTYSVPTSTPAIANQPYKDGETIAFDGLSFVVKGNPAAGDTMTLGDSTRDSLFGAMDKAISGVRNLGSANPGPLTHSITKTLAELDTGLSRLHAVRGFAGDLLNRVDRINSTQEGRAVQLEGDRSRAEDLDMIKGISDFQSNQTGYSAALSSYAQIQKLSLFNYLN